MDASQIERVLANLVQNGIKYSPPGSPIGVSARLTDDGELELSVEDEGPGIPYPDDERGPRRIMPDREIKENMVLCLECYAGKVGAPFGVKLEDQVLVTRDGARLICTYPYEAKLLD